MARSKNVDIIDVKIAVSKGELKIDVQKGVIFLEHTKSGERVCLHETEAAEVVRCKECKRWRPWSDRTQGFCPCSEHLTQASHFCSYGERRTDETKAG